MISLLVSVAGFAELSLSRHFLQSGTVHWGIDAGCAFDSPKLKWNDHVRVANVLREMPSYLHRHSDFALAHG